MTTTTRIGSVLAGGVALLTLSGCGGMHAGIAAKVGDTSISHDRVDTVSRIFCDLRKGQGAQPRAKQVQGTVNLLVETAVDNMYGDSVGGDYDHAALQAQIQQYQTAVAKLPKKDQATILSAFSEYTRGKLTLERIGEDKLKAQGQKKPSADEALNEGSKLAGTFAKKLDIQVDPRYNPGKSDLAGGGDGSISRTVSPYSKSASGSPSKTFVSSLPSELRCG